MADRQKLLGRWVRYLSVGGICALLHNVLMFLAYTMNIKYSDALVISFLVLAPAGYYLHSLYTFEEAFNWARLTRYAAGLIVGFLINFAIMFVLCAMLHLAIPIGTLIATGILFFFNYFVSHWAILLHRDTR